MNRYIINFETMDGLWHSEYFYGSCEIEAITKLDSKYLDTASILNISLDVELLSA